MRKFLLSIICLGFFQSITALASFPKNHLDLLDGKTTSNLTETQFNQISDAVIALFKPVVAAHGAILQVNKHWSDSTVNAFAKQVGKVWTVDMFGGMARRPEITLDGFALIVCHEVGHHLGGYYYTDMDDDGTPIRPDWGAAEGEADYFATHVCARKIFANALHLNHKFGAGVPAYVKERCDQSWTQVTDRDLCYRTAAASFSISSLLATIGSEKPVKFETPDKSIVRRTFAAHPKAQCRLDTYFSGALCPVPFDLTVIPGRGPSSTENSLQSEVAASKVSCTLAGGQTLGVRPACWFKPLMQSKFKTRL